MSTQTSTEARITALSQHLGEDAGDITVNPLSDTEFRFGRQEYRVLTDDEATEAAKSYIKETLWAFNVSFLSRFVPALQNKRAAKAWEDMVGELCEGANPLVEALIGINITAFCEAAIDADGRGHFLAGYDNVESDETVGETQFFIYRTN